MLLNYYLPICTLITTTYQQSMIDGVLKLFKDAEKQSAREPHDEKHLHTEYDFIIVGAGTAGCVLANRLTENPRWKILLIEAGGDENYLADIPILANYLQFTVDNWGYKTMPSNSYCLGMENHQCNWPRGRVMGGTSVLNYMIYTRGNYRDFDNWARMGNEGWSYKEILPYYKKIENFSVPHTHESYHSQGGYLDVSYAPTKTKVAEAFIQASQQMGLNYVDYDGPTQVGVSRLHVTLRDGVRESSSRAYLHPIKHRSNLHVRKRAMVSKILIDRLTKRTIGVEFYRLGKRFTIRARKEVIVSAGAINSPQLLMLSGIGPRKHLRQVGIPVLSNLKVGYNLMDHIALGGLTFLIDKPYCLTLARMLSVENARLYLNYRTGPFSIPGGCEALVFQDLKNPGDPDGYPDIELLFVAGSVVSDPLIRRDFGITDALYNKIFKPIEDFDAFMIFPMLMRPKSKGRIFLKDNHFRSKPLIDANYLAYEEDLDTIVGGVHLALNITSQPAMRAIGTRLHDIPIPQCEELGFGTNNYFRCMMRHLTFNIYHYSGTCKMGPASDKSAVVDPRLRVYGIKGLRVADASIIPEIPAAHTNAQTFMIAEKAADMIKQDWRWEHPDL